LLLLLLQLVSIVLAICYNRKACRVVCKTYWKQKKGIIPKRQISLNPCILQYLAVCLIQLISGYT
ncbi:hypothetical protein T08_3128, partial [Trichinella sp. T8]